MTGAPAPKVRVVRVVTRDQLAAAWQLRHEVFVVEQRVPAALEVDEQDTSTTTSHVLAVDRAGNVVGTGRLLLDGPGAVHIGRLAVRRAARGHGIGALLVAELCAIALAEHVTGHPPAVRVVLSAQEDAMTFYHRLGFTTVSGERYLDAGIWHQDMVRTLEPTAGG